MKGEETTVGRFRSLLRVLRAVWRGVSLVFLIAMVTTTVLVVLGASLGYRPVVILTGSMGDAAPPGSLILAKPTSDVGVGDILVMRGSDRATVTHRVVSLVDGEEGVEAVTRGDANADNDPQNYPITSEELVGQWVIDGGGELLLTVRSRSVALSLTLAVLLGFVVGALRRIWAPRAREMSPGLERDGDLPGGDVTTTNDDRARRRLAFATAFGVFSASAGIVFAVFSGTADVSANAFTTPTCFDARLNIVHKGQHTNNTDGTSTVTIPAVDPNRSILFFSASSDSNEADDSILLGNLANSTTIEFLRNSNGAPPDDIVVEWSVVEYDCGVTVQRGIASGNATTQVDVPITAVDTAASFVVGGSSAISAEVETGADNTYTVELANSTTVRFEAEEAIGVGRNLAWQVVEYDNGTDVSVQTIEVTLNSPVAGVGAVLPSTVDPTTTMILASVRTPNNGSTMGDRMARVELVDGDTVLVARGDSTGSITVVVQAVEFADGTVVEHGVVSMIATQTTATGTMLPVTQARSTALGTVMAPTGVSGGSTAMIADDVPGEGAARFRLTDEQTISVTRDASTAAASFAWQVVTWGGPAWADLSSPFRQRVAVVAGTVEAPNGYTTAVTIDHAALVASALSLADGSDLRLWRHNGFTWTELDRILDDGSAFDSATTTLRFRTQERIGAADAANYWLYFGDPTPDAVLDDPANVWLVLEGFDTGTLGAFEDRTGGTGWYTADAWTHRIPLTIASGLASSDVSNAMVMVDITSATLAAEAQDDGSDIRFTAADGTTAMSHEIEAFDGSTGALTAWVRVPTVASGSTTQIYLYTGADDAPDQADPRAAWSGTDAAWHMAADVGGTGPGLDDSGPRQLDGVALADATRSEFASGPAVSLDGSLDRVESSPLGLSPNAFTVATWIRADSVSGERTLVSQGAPATGGAFELHLDATGTPTFTATLRTDTGVVTVSGGTPVVSAWHAVVLTFDGTTLRLYVDGTVVGSQAAGTPVTEGPRPMSIGAESTGTNALVGAIGEVWVDDDAWAVERVELFHALLDDPAGSVSVGATTSSTWFSQGTWAVRRPVVISDALASATLTNFPLLVQITDAALGARGEADGSDIVFTSDDGTTRLDHQIESWNSGTGELIAWVRVPTIAGSADTTVYLYIDNASAVNQEDPAGTWGPDADLIIVE